MGGVKRIFDSPGILVADGLVGVFVKGPRKIAKSKKTILKIKKAPSLEKGWGPPPGNAKFNYFRPSTEILKP